ncbi:MAG TPA: hypothetical protein VG144_00375 [Gaiellaceae bacterium]|nr:hypothetical protein [Gaiellaceae bacterium]
MQTAFGTIVAKRELPYARVLAASLAEHQPESPFLVLLADEVEGCFDPASEPFELLTLAELRIPNAERLRFLHRRLPLSYASTPYFLSALLERGFESVVFLKQETLVLGKQTPLLEALSQAPIVLTPHLLAPLPGPDGHGRELNILQSGTFNCGVVGLRDSSTARRFLAWWQDRVFAHCAHAVADGMHYEQRWLDLVPAYFRDAHVLRDRGTNIGHWNLPERSGEAPRILRFSGFDPERPEEVTRYSGRVRMDELGSFAGRFAAYAQALREARWDEAQAWPYAYDRFANGVPIPTLARDLYAKLGDNAERFGDPFSTGARSFYGWLNERVAPARRVTRLWLAVWRLRADLRAAFPDPLRRDEDAFAHWIELSGVVEHELDAAFLPGPVGDVP